LALRKFLIGTKEIKNASLVLVLTFLVGVPQFFPTLHWDNNPFLALCGFAAFFLGPVLFIANLLGFFSSLGIRKNGQLFCLLFYAIGLMVSVFSFLLLLKGCGTTPF
jgi:hypothetical protein